MAARTPSAALETAAMVALVRRGTRPSSVYAALAEDAGSALPILHDEQGLLADQLLDDAAVELARWDAQGIRVLTPLDADYPENLRAVHDRPALLFIRGRLEPRDARSVAVIGSRRASPSGIARACAIANELVEAGYTVVSGLAAGIDTAAHKAALAAAGRTIAVIGTGLLHAYPAQNAALQQTISGDGAVLSQFWPETGPGRRNFPLRNAVMSGVALATIVAQATQTSGARAQVRSALAHGRPVLLDSALMNQQWARELASRPAVYVIHSLSKLSELLAQFSATDELRA